MFGKHGKYTNMNTDAVIKPAIKSGPRQQRAKTTAQLGKGRCLLVQGVTFKDVQNTG